MKNYLIFLLLFSSTYIYSQDWFLDLKIELPDGSIADTIRIGCSENALISYNDGLDILDTSHSFPLAVGLFVEDAPGSPENCTINLNTKFLPFNDTVDFLINAFAVEQFVEEDLIISIIDTSQFYFSTNSLRLVEVNVRGDAIDFVDNTGETPIFLSNSGVPQVSEQFSPLGGNRLGAPNQCGLSDDVSEHRNSLFSIRVIFGEITGIFNKNSSNKGVSAQYINGLRHIRLTFDTEFQGEIILFDFLGRELENRTLGKTVKTHDLQIDQTSNISFIKLLNHKTSSVQTLRIAQF